MTYQKEARLILEMTDLIKTMCPYDTGNLESSIKYEYLGNGKWRIYVNSGDDPYMKDYPRGIAPYMPFTNEPWVSPKWNNKTNPNQGWWNIACEQAIEYARIKLGGEIYVRD